MLLNDVGYLTPERKPRRNSSYTYNSLLLKPKLMNKEVR